MYRKKWARHSICLSFRLCCAVCVSVCDMCLTTCCPHLYWWRRGGRHHTTCTWWMSFTGATARDICIMHRLTVCYIVHTALYLMIYCRVWYICYTHIHSCNAALPTLHDIQCTVRTHVHIAAFKALWSWPLYSLWKTSGVKGNCQKEWRGEGDGHKRDTTTEEGEGVICISCHKSHPFSLKSWLGFPPTQGQWDRHTTYVHNHTYHNCLCEHIGGCLYWCGSLPHIAE